MARGDDDALARLDAVAVEIGARRIGQENARTVIVREDQRAFDRALRQNHVASPDLPQPLARGAGLHIGKMLGQALIGADHVVGVIGEGVGAGEEGDIGEAFQLGDRGFQPFGGALAVDGGLAFSQKRAARFGLFVDQEDALAALGRRQSRRDSGGACADDQHFAVGVAVLIGVRVGQGRGLAQARRLADDRFVQLVPGAARPHEGLVVEARRDEAGKQVVDHAYVEAKVRPAVLALGDQTLIDLYLGGAEIGRKACPVPRDAHQGVRLFGPGRNHAARAVILEGTAHQHHAVRQQRRGQGVARMAGIAGAVKGEADRAAAVDAAAGL